MEITILLINNARKVVGLNNLYSVNRKNKTVKPSQSHCHHHKHHRERCCCLQNLLSLSSGVGCHWRLFQSHRCTACRACAQLATLTRRDNSHCRLFRQTFSETEFSVAGVTLTSSRLATCRWMLWLPFAARTPRSDHRLSTCPCTSSPFVSLHLPINNRQTIRVMTCLHKVHLHVVLVQIHSQFYAINNIFI